MRTSLKSLAIAGAVALALAVGGCSQVAGWFGQDREVANPVAEADLADTKVLAAYGLVTIALEEAATIAENPNTPDRVVLAISRAAPVALASANIARTAAVEYRHARVAYESASAAGNDTTALVLTLTQSGLRLTQAINGLKDDLATLKRALNGGDAPALDDATQLLESAAIPQ